MKSEKGVTLTSLIVYVIAMVVVVATITTLTNYFYGNLDKLNNRVEGSKEYTTFSSYFINDINTKDNNVISCETQRIIFSNGNQYTFQSGAIYMNKIQICRDVEICSFNYDETAKVITVSMKIADKNYNNSYTLTNAK